MGNVPPPGGEHTAPQAGIMTENGVTPIQLQTAILVGLHEVMAAEENRERRAQQSGRQQAWITDMRMSSSYNLKVYVYLLYFLYLFTQHT